MKAFHTALKKYDFGMDIIILGMLSMTVELNTDDIIKTIPKKYVNRNSDFETLITFMRAILLEAQQNNYNIIDNKG